MYKRKPSWLRVGYRSNEHSLEVKEMLNKLSLHTVCQEAKCPNIVECFGKRTATFMILGRICTRKCTFCNVEKNQSTPLAVDPLEPEHVAQAVAQLKLKHVVITSVSRDDLEDGGASQFAKVIRAIKDMDSSIIVEVLIPDFNGSLAALQTVAAAKPEIINHNVETVPRLYPKVRPQAIYERSLELLARVKELDSSIHTKSGIILGLGEQKEEVLQTLKDLRAVDCDLMTIGQYLAPSAKHHPVIEYVSPEEFEYYKKVGEEYGFKYVASAPLVRSSYHAEKVSEKLLNTKEEMD
ncbi:MAG: lipoyl synthase [Firmicutes bacterium]|nr:lipoyl synthase [Bacillota bacterium]